MEEQYKGHVIRITTERDNSTFPWKPICKILDGASRAIIKEIDWQIGYDTLERAEKAGLLISKKWIDVQERIHEQAKETWRRHREWCNRVLRVLAPGARTKGGSPMLLRDYPLTLDVLGGTFFQGMVAEL
jgi:hypothetical protein